MKIKPDAILFDLDGVLIDSLASWWKALNQALTAYHYPEIQKEEFINKFWGHDLYDILKTMKLDPEVVRFCNTIYGDHIHEIKIFPDTKPTIKKLKNYQKAIITNTPRDCTYQILQRFSLDHYFPIVVTCDDVHKAKPDPEPILKACHLLQVNPNDILLIGDTESDVKAGRSAGCAVVGINIDADFTIGKLSELVQLIE